MARGLREPVDEDDIRLDEVVQVPQSIYTTAQHLLLLVLTVFSSIRRVTRRTSGLISGNIPIPLPHFLDWVKVSLWDKEGRSQ